MENNKISISLSTVIIIAVIIGALILGLISFYIYNLNEKDSESLVANNDNIQQSESITENNSNNNDNNNDKDNTNNKENNSSTIIDNSSNTSENNETSNNNSTTTPEKPVTSTETTAKSSSKTAPVAIGEWTLASKYASGDYVDVPVKVTNVTRGSSAQQIVKDYCNSGSTIYKYTDAEDGMEWAVFEYQVDLTKMEKESSIRLDTDITGTGSNTSVKYNGYTYIISTMNMTSGYTKGEIVTCQFAAQLPIGCTDYLIEIGTSSHTQAFIKGK